MSPHLAKKEEEEDMADMEKDGEEEDIKIL